MAHINKNIIMRMSGVELRAFCVWSRLDIHYTTEPHGYSIDKILILYIIKFKHFTTSWQRCCVYASVTFYLHYLSWDHEVGSNYYGQKNLILIFFANSTFFIIVLWVTAYWMPVRFCGVVDIKPASNAEGS